MTTQDPGPMDPSAPEGPAKPTDRRKRACYAALTLVQEVAALFPETPTEFGDFDGRNTALSVTFSTGEAFGLADLLSLVGSDQRVREVETSDISGEVRVTFRSSARTQDSREPFGLGRAWEIMADAAEDGTLPVRTAELPAFVRKQAAEHDADLAAQGFGPGADDLKGDYTQHGSL